MVMMMIREVPMQNIFSCFSAELHENVPNEMRPFIRKSNASFSAADLTNITQLEDNLLRDPLGSSNNEIHLITQWYYESDHRRRLELVRVLRMNVINNAITKIHVIENSKISTVLEDVLVDADFPSALLQSKLIIAYQEDVNPDRRLTLAQALDYANRAIPTGYAMIANLDIIFDQSFQLLKKRPILDPRTVLYLSRYEIDPSISSLGLQCSDDGYVGSHDGLIFRSPISGSVIEQLPFEIGTWNIEVKVVYELVKAKYVVRNPCKSLRIWHLHSSQVRRRKMPAKRYVPYNLVDFVMRRPEVL